MKKLLVIIIGLVLITTLWRALGATADKYIRGKYGTRCYTEGQEHGNIKYPVEYETLKDCEDSLR